MFGGALRLGGRGTIGAVIGVSVGGGFDPAYPTPGSKRTGSSHTSLGSLGIAQPGGVSP